jgi:hypothetical protein
MTTTLYSFFPDADELTDLPPHVVGPVLLKLALPRQQQAGVQIEAVLDTPILDVQQGRDWPFHKKQAALRAAHRAWNWLHNEGFIEPTPGMNGRNGWFEMTEKAAKSRKATTSRAFSPPPIFRRTFCIPPFASSAGPRSSKAPMQARSTNCVRQFSQPLLCSNTA